MTLFSGDWLCDEGDCVYNKAYEGIEINRYSGGVVWKTTRSIAKRIVEDQKKLTQDVPEAGRMVLTTASLVTYEPCDGEFYVQDFDEHGFVRVPSWAWTPVDPSEVREVVGWTT